MNPIATKYGASPLPQVNLVPKEINDKRTMRFVQTIAGIAVAAAVVLIAVAYVGAYATKSVAKDSLYQAFSEEDAAVAARDERRDVYQDYVVQETAELTLTQIGWAELSYADLLASVLAQDNDQMSFGSVHFYGPNANGFGGAEVDPVFGGGVGRVDFVAYVRTYEEALALIARLEEVPGLAKVYATAQNFESGSPNTTLEVDGTAVLAPLLLNGRLIPAEGIVQEQILDSIGNQSTSESTASPSPSSEPAADAESEN